MPDSIWRRLPQKLFMALLLFWATSSIATLLVIALAPGRPWLLLLAVYAAFMPAILGTLVPTRRLLCGVLLLAGLYALCLGLLSMDGPYGWWVFAYPLLLLTPMAAFALRASALPAGDEWPAGLLMAFAFLHIVAYVLLRMDTFALARPLLNWFAPLYTLCLLLEINGETLRSGVALRKDHRPPRRIVLRNQGMLIIFAGIVLLIVNVQHLRTAYYAALQGILYAVAWVMDMLTRLYPMQETGGGEGGGGGDFGLPFEEAEPSWLAQFLERLVQYVVVILLVAIAVFVLYFLGKKLLRLLRVLRDKWAKYASSLNTAYEDEAESLFDWGEMAQTAQEKFRGLLTRITQRKPSWQAMDNRERIRYAYQTLLKKHPDVPASRTASTLLQSGELPTNKADAGRLASAYDAARYSDRPIPDEDAENAKRAMD